MPQKVRQTEFKPEPGWNYFLDVNGDISRAPTDGDGDDAIEKVAILGFKISDDDPLLYFVDADGDLASETAAEYEQGLAADWKQTEDEVLREYEAKGFKTAFEPESNRYWIVKGNRRFNDLREMLEPRRVHTWRTARLPRDIAAGDRLVFWESAPNLHAVGIGEVGAWDREKDLFGNAHFWPVYQSRFVDGVLGVDMLRKEKLFEGASFLKAAVAGTMFPLQSEQGRFLAEKLAEVDASIRGAWPDVFDETNATQQLASPTTAHISAEDEEAADGGEEAGGDEYEKLIELGIQKEDGWLYQVAPEGVYRVPESDPDKRKKWLHKTPIEFEPGYLYFVDSDGDLARISAEVARASIRRDRIAERKTPTLSAPLVLPSFDLTSGQTYRVLSVHGPWAWSILFAGKDIENRTWTTPYRGPILVHASSKKYVGKALAEARSFIAECSGMPLDQVPHDFPRSQLLGAVDVVDCVQEHESPWAESFGHENWVLTSPRALSQPVEGVDGKLNLWSWTCP